MKDLQKKSEADIAKLVAEKREELRALRFGASGSGTRDVRAQRNTRKDIARGLTELNKRAQAADVAPENA